MRSRFSSRSIRSRSSSVSRRICCCWSRSRLSCRSISSRLAGLGGLEGRLQFLQSFVQVALPLGQLAEAVEHLARSRAARCSVCDSCSLLGSGRALLLVAVFLVRELELLELPLRRAAARASAALPLLARIVADDLEFPCAQLEQRLVGGLLGDQGRA